MTPEPGPVVVQDYMPSSPRYKISSPGLVKSSLLKHLPPSDDNPLHVILHLASVRMIIQMESQTRNKHLKTNTHIGNGESM